jgi:general secretion pathway protein E
MSEISKKIRIQSANLKKIKNIAGFKKEVENSLNKSVTGILEIVFGGAILLEASDIHFEPKEEKTKIRVRIDGVLQDLIFFEKKLYDSLLSRLKLLSGVKLNIVDRPQDGRLSAILDETTVEIRASILPSEYGESVVLRILNPKSLLNLKTLGLRKDLLSLFKKEIKKPNGMIIITGPTGSGKTTSLYAFLKEIRKPEIKIITIEDPIEYHLKGISQTQTDPKSGYDFATGLKSIMRQDPDVILVGEIRDLETCKIALQAALTGHLVFTTLHTNDAAGTIARLVNLGAKPSDIGPAINMAVAQRLVRKVCKKCGEMVDPTPLELKKIKSGLRKIPKGMEVFKNGKTIKIPKTKGCKSCNYTGYRGRVGIFEAFLVDDKMEKFILKTPSTATLKEEAIERGMVTIYQDGLIKVLEGTTTLEEVERVAAE